MSVLLAGCRNPFVNNLEPAREQIRNADRTLVSGDAAQADRSYTDALRLIDDDGGVTIMQLRGGVRLRMGVAAILLGDSAAAVDHFQAALDSNTCTPYPVAHYLPREPGLAFLAQQRRRIRERLEGRSDRRLDECLVSVRLQELLLRQDTVAARMEAPLVKGQRLDANGQTGIEDQPRLLVRLLSEYHGLNIEPPPSISVSVTFSEATRQYLFGTIKTSGEFSRWDDYYRIIIDNPANARYVVTLGERLGRFKIVPPMSFVTFAGVREPYSFIGPDELEIAVFEWKEGDELTFRENQLVEVAKFATSGGQWALLYNIGGKNVYRSQTVRYVRGERSSLFQ